MGTVKDAQTHNRRYQNKVQYKIASVMEMKVRLEGVKGGLKKKPTQQQQQHQQ